MDKRFAMVPPEVIADRGLSLEQLRVLLALYSFKAVDSDVVFPSRQAIADMTGMHLSNISTATSALEAKGWLKKDGKGGHSKATRYTITIPNTVAQSATVAELATVAQSATGTVAEQATGLRVAESATGKEQTSEQTKITKKVFADDFNPQQWLIERGVTPKHARDWMKVRKAKKAANTETTFDVVLAQAEKAGWTLDQAVAHMTGCSWASFRADWVKDVPIKTASVGPETGATRQRFGVTERFDETMGWVPVEMVVPA